MSRRAFSNPINPETLDLVPRWQDCSARCQAKASCLHWEWRGGDHTCVLNEGFVKTVDSYHAISGNRDCKGVSETCQDENPLSDVSEIMEVKKHPKFEPNFNQDGQNQKK